MWNYLYQLLSPQWPIVLFHGVKSWWALWPSGAFTVTMSMLCLWKALGSFPTTGGRYQATHVVHRQYIICVYYYCADLMLSMHVQLLPQGGDLSVFLLDLLFDNVLHLYRLLSGSTFAVKVISVLLQLMWKTRRERSLTEDLIALSSYLILAVYPGPGKSCGPGGTWQLFHICRVSSPNVR